MSTITQNQWVPIAGIDFGRLFSERLEQQQLNKPAELVVKQPGITTHPLCRYGQFLIRFVYVVGWASNVRFDGENGGRTNFTVDDRTGFAIDVVKFGPEELVDGKFVEVYGVISERPGRMRSIRATIVRPQPNITISRELSFYYESARVREAIINSGPRNLTNQLDEGSITELWINEKHMPPTGDSILEGQTIESVDGVGEYIDKASVPAQYFSLSRKNSVLRNHPAFIELPDLEKEFQFTPVLDTPQTQLPQTQSDTIIN